MQATDTTTSPEFAGTSDQQELAARVFALFRAHGRFFSEQAAIRIPLEQLATFMAKSEGSTPEALAATIDAALSASGAVFGREEQDGVVSFVTTRAGRAVVDEDLSDPNRHVLIQRFETPKPKRERPKQPLTRPTVYDRQSDGGFDDVQQWDLPEGFTPEDVARARQRLIDEPLPETPVPRERPAPAPAEVVAPPVAARVAETIDAAAASDAELADAIRTSLSREITVAQWGDQWMAEDRVQRFSRGDLRRIEELLREQDNIATDEEIVQDVLGIRASAPEYGATRFAVNYRLSRETREFEYVGSDTVGIWTLANQPQIGTARRKPSEIGQDYRFLLDYRAVEEPIEEGIVEHVLSFYEYIYGVLPLDATLATMMPKAGFAEQRAARVTFESPQTMETVVAELRFPTGNRGGFIAGLEQFFAENLVPGGVITIEKTDQPNHYLLEYFRVSAEDRKLLHLDERKGKYAFRSTTYYCATQDEFVLSESRFPKLADAKPLDERQKRRPEQVIAATFERVGENVGSAAEPRYWAIFTDLLAAANIERPISADLLRDILTSGTYQEFSADESTEDAFFYQP